MKQLVSLAVVLFVLGIPVAAQIGTKQSRIVDIDGKGVPDVTITETASCSSSVPPPFVTAAKTYVTDAEGYFNWPQIGGPGTGSLCAVSVVYGFSLSKAGYTFTRAGFGYKPGPEIVPGNAPYDTRLPLIHALSDATPRWAVVSAAHFGAVPLTNDMIVAGFGAELATETASTTSLPLPTTLGNRRVLIRDSAGVERAAKLIFVSPGQSNFITPGGMAEGAAVVRVVDANNAQLKVGLSEIAPVSLGLFSANGNGTGVAAGFIVRVKPGDVQFIEQIARFDTTLKRYVFEPIDFGPASDDLYLILFGTGFRRAGDLSYLTVSVGGTNGGVYYAGPQPSLDGLDQINVKLPRSLAGRSEVEVVVSVGGQLSNTLRVQFR